MKKISKGGPGSGRRPSPGGGAFGHGRSTKPDNYSERLSSSNTGRPRAGVRPIDLYPHGRNQDGSARTSNDLKPAAKRR